MQVLYLEDNPHDAELAQISLGDAAPEVELDISPTLASARQQLSKKHYDAALVDMRLPDGTGIEFIASVRQTDRELALVVLTGLDDETITVAALKAGADDYLVKGGAYLEQVPTALHNAIRRHKTQKPRRAHTFSAVYVEHLDADAELTQHHFKRFAPYIDLTIIRSGDAFLELMAPSTNKPSQCDVLLLDYRMPGRNALELVKELRERYDFDIPVILITGQGGVEIAVQALRMGAMDYVVKQPGYLERLPAILENAYQYAELERQRAYLQQSLEEQQRLTSELFHRTGNNIQVINSIIALQGMLLDDPKATAACHTIRQRVKSLALVQKMLGENRQLNTVRLDKCLERLAHEIHHQRLRDDTRIHLDLHLEPITVLLDIAQPCSMILTELLTNAYQHAFPDDRAGTITIILRRSGKHEITVTVRDDGVGVANDFDVHAQRSFGLQAVVMIAQHQLQGQVSVDTGNGFACTIILRDDLYQARV